MLLHLSQVPSPIGAILLVTDDGHRLRALDFHDYEDRMRELLRRQYGAVALQPGSPPPAIADALAAYFAGDRTATERIPVETAGTPFQRQVWAALRCIPAGTTTTYGGIAAALGRRGASRAVGLANGSNPVAIVVPCHRVIGANAALTGFGGGLHRKQWLLEHEGALPTASARLL
jgi:methylated-DNA-[protein]-cysteine S-methyltransferase